MLEAMSREHQQAFDEVKKQDNAHREDTSRFINLGVHPKA
jgi:hypothetical protein